jgi:Na+-translocating ferredoxin:NAD+ oxidoreductase RnfD subunit
MTIKIKYFKNPKIQVISFLIALWGFWIFVMAGNDAFTASLQTMLAVATAVFAQLAFSDKLSGTSFLSAIVTGMLIGMLTVPGVDLKIIWLAATCAIASKSLLKFPSGKHIFNPASFGLILTSVFFGNKINWWGFSNPYIVMILGGLILYRLNRLSLVFSYLIFRILSAYIFDGNISIVQAMLMPNLFFAFIMLIEPKTSPGKRLDQWIFGGICGALSSLFFMLNLSFDGDLTALLVVNFIRPILESIKNYFSGITISTSETS